MGRMIQETESKQTPARMVGIVENSETIRLMLEQDVRACFQTLHNQCGGESQC